LPPLKAARAEPNGRNAEVDYMLGTSGCRIAGQRNWGARVLNFALYSYPLTASSRTTITEERDRCVAAAPITPLSAAARVAVSSAIVAGATARGKLFDFGDRGIASYPARRTRELTDEEKAGRLFPLGSEAEATAALKVRAGRLRALSGARIQVKGRFAIVTVAGQTDGQLAQLSTTFENYVSFLQREYGVSLPDRYITLYIVPDIRGVQAVANQVHGLDASPSTVGYSFQDDLSAVAMINGTAQGGTLMHELFHLLVRSSFGDIPQWLDEGVASLYEVSARRGDRYVGLPNWRGRVLRTAWGMRPSLSTVISSPWFAFDRVDGESAGYMIPDERIAVHLATARYLALYLQDKGELKNVFEAFRERDPGDSDDPGAAAISIIERRMGSIAELQSSYDAWLKEALRQDATSSSPPPPPPKGPPNPVSSKALAMTK